MALENCATAATSRAADSTLAELIAKDKVRPAYQIAQVFAWRGEVDKAFGWLQISLDIDLRHLCGHHFAPVLVGAGDALQHVT